ncbi:amidase [Ottowia thiooxydans]|uniref:amidase n=1 Tax=Ottowia thiooxydans TaxID=219182 RepID=UPI000427C1E0|nr:amidase [Ottowia thiooxydans]
MTDLPTIEQLSKELAAGRTTSVQLTEAALARASDPQGEGAKTFVALSAERALAAARASDLLRTAGIVRSPLEGLPVSVKDLFDVAGEVTTAGSAVLRGGTPATHSAPVIERLVAAGAVIVGRTSMTEFAFSGLGLNPHYGTPKNPWDRATGRIPGGSSSGAAVSVADGMAVVGIGSDTGGSVRIPSALCGLTGFKPTQRRVPTEGALPLSTSLDSIGPLAASVHCCAIVDAILAGEAPLAPLPRSLAGARFAVPETVVFDGVDAVVAAAFEAACARLQSAGALITRLAIPEFSEMGRLHARGTLANAEAWAWHRTLLTERGAEYDPRVSGRIRAGEKMGAADYIDLIQARKRWITQVEARIAGFDALLLPTVPVIAPPIAELQSSDEAYAAANGLILRNPTLINFLDGCALSLPCHAKGEPPVGLMLAGAGGRDREILALGLATEQILLARH